MSPINHLNPPPNPFWNFMSDMENHPFFAAYGPTPRPGQAREDEPAPATGSANTNEKRPNVEDPPEVDPSTLRGEGQDDSGPRRRERRGCGRRHDSSSEGEGRRDRRRRECGGRRGWGRSGSPPPGPFGPGQFGPGQFGPGFPFARFPGGPFWAHNHGPHPPSGQSPAGDQSAGEVPTGPPSGPGPHGRGGFSHRGGPHAHDHRVPHHGPQHGPHHGPRHGPHGHGHGHGRRGPLSPPGGPGFDLSRFLNELGDRIGMDLSGATQSLGLDRFMPSQDRQEVDFEPKFDIFDLATTYTIHLSLPGAKKSDVGVEWDGEHSAIRVAGVVHRPEVDESMLEHLVVDGRKRENGVFEKLIKLGTRHEPANVDVANIKARMRDGVLIIAVPKVEKVSDKREVPIAKSETPSPVRGEKERDLLFDADHVMAEAQEPVSEVQVIDRTTFEQSTPSKGKQAEYEAEKAHNRESRDSSATVEAEAERQPEPLPVYTAVQQQERERREGSDWENFGSDDEGEYVKINVD